MRPLTSVARIERVRALARTAAVLSGATLVAFHGCLFAIQAAQGELDDPWLLLRWLVAAALVAALAAIRRHGGSIWDRRGMAVWVLAALLHGPSVGSDVAVATDSLSLPETVATSILESLRSVSVLAATLWMLGGLLGLHALHARFFRITVADAHGANPDDGFSPPYASRPPPQYI